MTWTELHQRTDIVHTVLARAQIDPNDPHLFADLPGLDRLFGGVEGLLQALANRWDNHLRVKVELGEIDGTTPVEAYLVLAAEQPALRALLDAHTAIGQTTRDRALAH
ncbi:hypothetical protein [Nocardia caishijiensis]|uniref:Uncharacterized protein n=1 Tax=Nocardia caishijiensis TaxID=184756 RepID=A0ABQ6YFA6_9NOCA|nr:hypothetical protein [Nocardia caishijiensis]KAF0836646.1 hypothetical protein FNL39_11354 [Nocardia caishijiensis]